MTSKERVLRAVNHQEVDHVPAGLFGTGPEYEEKLVEHLKAGSPEDMYKALGIDLWHCWNTLDYIGEPMMFNGEEVGLWGAAADFTTVDEVEAYPWPSADDFSGDRLAREIADHQEFAVVGEGDYAIFHHYLWMCGQENGLAHLTLQPDLADAVIRHITDFWVGYLTKVLEAGQGGIDIIENCNDFGTQRGLFISAAMFRRFFKPALQRLYDVCKSYGVKVMQHSCGSIEEIIPDLIEMGADILNPIQVTAEGMEIGDLAAKYGGRITFYGGIDTQRLLPDGPPELIRQETRRVIDLFGNNGGYILAGSQGLLLDIPLEHTIAMFEEGLK